jgi:chaperonin GroES
MKLAPTGSRIIVRPRDRETVSAGGIVIPDTAKQRIDSGEVIACGPCVDPEEVAPGMTVWFRHFAGTELADGLLLVDDSECLMAEDLA